MKVRVHDDLARYIEAMVDANPDTTKTGYVNNLIERGMIQDLEEQHTPESVAAFRQALRSNSPAPFMLLVKREMRSLEEHQRQREIAEEKFAEYDFGNRVVKDTGPWQRVNPRRLKRKVYFENGDKPSTQTEFIVQFTFSDPYFVSIVRCDKD